MKILIFSLLLTTGMSVGMQAQDFEWAKAFPGVAGGKDIAVDATGNIYVIGDFQDTTDFDPGPNVFNLIPKGHWDIFITKMDPSGNLIWAKQLGGPGQETAVAIGVDASGNVYTTGLFNDTTDFNPGTGAGDTFSLKPAGYDIFINKLDASGNFVWAKQIGGAGFDRSRSLNVTPSGTLYLTGKFDGSVDFNPATGVGDTAFLHSAGTGTAKSDIFIAEFNASGNLQWAKQIGGVEGKDVLDLEIDHSGNLYLTGHFAGTADFDPDPANVHHLTAGIVYDAFIAKLNPQGNLIWAKSYGGSRSVDSYNIAVDGSGNVYTTGEIHSDTVDFDPGTGPNDTFYLTAIVTSDWFPGTAFISKLDASGNFVWAKTIGTYSIGSEIIVDVSDNVYVAGSHAGQLSFTLGTGDTTKIMSGSNLNTDRGAFIARLDGGGTYGWAAGLAGTSLITGISGIAVDPSGSIYSTGGFQGTVDFDPGTDSFKLTAKGFTVSDAFVHKLSQGGVGIQDKEEVNLLSVYPNPTNGTFIIHIEEEYSEVDVFIRNINGQLISVHQLHSSEKLQLDIPGNAGIYFVEVRKDNDKPINLKVLKQ